MLKRKNEAVFVAGEPLGENKQAVETRARQSIKSISRHASRQQITTPAGVFMQACGAPQALINHSGTVQRAASR